MCIRDSVYGVTVMLPATHLEPGVVQASSAPTTGILDIGRIPDGTDERAEAISAAFRSATFESVPRDDIMRWKWRKLLMNLGNVVDAACGRAHGNGDVLGPMWEEADRVLEAAGLDIVTAEEDQERRGDYISIRPVGGNTHRGGSSWQSLARGAGSIETDLFNGEIVLLARQYGLDAPINAALQRVGRRLAASGATPGAMAPEELAAEVLPAG